MDNVETVIVGKRDVIRMMLVSVLCEGHVLFEDVPGVAKTMLARAMAKSIGLSFSRVQGTPDLLPSDITGVSVFNQKASEFEFVRGPVFHHIVLADEINRATPRAQAALLEAMAERQVTVDGQTYQLAAPFFVIATQNPIEQEGTYPLPEAQLDRFLLKILVSPPSAAELVSILDRTTETAQPHATPVATAQRIEQMKQAVRLVPAATHVKEYVARLVLATSPGNPAAPAAVKKYVRFGSSPRGAQAILLAAKTAALCDRLANLSFDDIRASAPPALRHRLILSFEGQADGITTDQVVRQVLEAVKERT